MSEMIDSFLYNYYDFIRSIYLYSHIKTSLIDPQRQTLEIAINIILGITSSILTFTFLFKIFIILFYFLFMQSLTGFINFIISIFKTRLKINFCSSFINSMHYLVKIFKRFYTFNFYLFKNRYIGFLMVSSYFVFIFSNIMFNLKNFYLLDIIEKPKYYVELFYVHFESSILIQLLISSFYACRDMKISSIIGLSIFVVFNIILILGYFITDRIEKVDGIFECNEPQHFMSLVFNAVFLFLNSISLCNIIFYKKDCK